MKIKKSAEYINKLYGKLIKQNVFDCATRLLTKVMHGNMSKEEKSEYEKLDCTITNNNNVTLF